MKFHQNMEKIHSGSSTKLWGNWKQKGMLLLQSLPSLPAQTCHIRGCTNLVWEGTWGTSRAQRTFCSLAAPCASHPNVLSYLARVSYASSCQQQAFTGFLWYLPSWLEAPCVFTTFLGCHHQALPEVTDGFAFCCKGTKHAAMPGERLVLLVLVPSEECNWIFNSFNCSAPRNVLTIPAQNHLHFFKDMANQWSCSTALSPPGCTTQSHLTP